mgnify:CR=1 FL=1
MGIKTFMIHTGVFQSQIKADVSNKKIVEMDNAINEKIFAEAAA